MHPAFTSQTIQLLKQYGIAVPSDINVQKKGMTVPMQLLAAMKNDEDMASSDLLLQFFSEFIEQGYDLTLCNQDGEDLFFQACRFFMTEEMPLYRLVDSGANLNTVNHQGFTPVLMAIEEGATDFVRYLLLEGAQLEFEPSNPNLHPLTLAKRHAHSEQMTAQLLAWQAEHAL